MNQRSAFLLGLLLGSTAVLGGRWLLDAGVATSAEHRALPSAERARHGDRSATAIPEAVPRADVQPLAPAFPAPASQAPPTPAMAEGDHHDDGGAAGILVYGAITDSTGAAVPMSTNAGWLNFTPGGGTTHRVRAEVTGSYAAPGLPPGPCRVQASLPGYQPLARDLSLPADQTAVRVDLVVELAVHLIIRGVTSDGRPLTDVLPKSLGLGAPRLCAVATAAPPASPLPETADGLHDRWGMGRYRNGLHRPPFGIAGEIPADALGRLEVLGPLPAYVSLVYRGLVLQTLRVEPGATSVEFSVLADTFSAQVGGLRVRLVDSDTGRPLAEARAQLNELNQWGFDDGHVSGTDGILSWSDEPPGLRRLAIDAEGFEEWEGRVTIPAGGVADLGTVPLDPAAWVSGIVRDARGAPQSADLVLVPVHVPEQLFERESSWLSTDETGQFTFERVGRREFEIRVGVDRWAARPVPVSTRAGNVVDLLVIVEPGVEVRLDPRWSATEQRNVEIRSGDGYIAMTRRTLRGDQAQTRRMLPGSYEALIYGENGAPLAIPFEITHQPVLLPLTP